MYVERVDEHTTIQLVRVGAAGLVPGSGTPATPAMPGTQCWRYLVASALVTIARGVVQAPSGQPAPEVARGIRAGLAGQTNPTATLAA